MTKSGNKYIRHHRFRKKHVVLFLLLCLLLGPFLIHRQPPLPPGFNTRSKAYSIHSDKLKLLIDSTAISSETNNNITNHQIFDQILKSIDQADQFIYLDFFLWNPWKGASTENYRNLSQELAAALIKKKQAYPDLPIIVVTDPINRIYGTHEPAFFQEMAKMGIPVIFTDLNRFPDSNFLYATYAKTYGKVIHWILSKTGLIQKQSIKNPFDSNEPKISLQELGRLLYFKANHRKVIITQSAQNGIEMIVGSLNPANGSAFHHNLAIKANGPVCLDALQSELTLASWSASIEKNILLGSSQSFTNIAEEILTVSLPPLLSTTSTAPSAKITWLTEGKIHQEIVTQLSQSRKGDQIYIALFYLSERKIIKAIKQAAINGASIKLILDANSNAFGRSKSGIPNRPVAAELMKLAQKHDIAIRWAATHGEQFHGKALCIYNKNTKKNTLLLGSANWTRRNIGELNAEANLLIEEAPDLIAQFTNYYQMIWTNDREQISTLDYTSLGENGGSFSLKYWFYRIQEATGFSTF
jgi:hypothetical protein